MRHRNKKNKLGRSQQQRKAILKSLASALILKERISTTEGKAKKLRPFIERMISRSKQDTIASKRVLLKTFSSRIVAKMLKEIGPRYIDRKGGYTRIIKANPRKADSAKMVLIELVK